MRRLPVISLALILCATAAVADGITPTQLLDIEQVRSADISPDGTLAAYTVTRNRSLEDEAGSSWSRLWVVATDGGEPRPFVTGEVAVGAPHFSPDGRYLGFTLKRGKDAKTQVWVMPVDGGEARPATASPTGIGAWSWSHDGAALFYVDTEEAPADEKKLKKKGWLPRYYEENLRDRVLRRVPFAFAAEPGEAEALVEGLAVWSLNVGPTGRRVAFAASTRNLVDHRSVFRDIHLLDLASGEHRKVVDVPGKLGSYRLSPDGERLAWTAAASRSDHAVSSLYVATASGAGQANLTPPGFRGHVREVVWRDATTLLYRADEGLHPTLSRQDATAGPDAREVLLNGADLGLVVGMPAARPGTATMVLVGHDPATPRELFAWDGAGAPVRLTGHNPWLAEVELGEQRMVRWIARDGLEIEGILMLPVGHDGDRFPLVANVHGGPESNHSDGWLSRYANPGQALCARGYGVLFANYRGSTGYGLEFAAAAFGEPAGPEFDDIVDGIDHLVAEGLVDGEHVGVMGGSYGGYATNWLVTKYTDRFRAGVSFVGVSDLVSKRFLTDIPYEDEYVHMGRPVRESWDLMLERSPVRYAAQSRTPLLILHGDSDPRVHPSQSQEMYRALKMAGHPAVRLIYYPGEAHGNTKRFGREDFVRRTMAWFDHYLLEGAAWDGPMPALDLSGELEVPEED